MIDTDIGTFMRQIIAQHVASDKETYTQAMLGRPNLEYCEWILRLDSWGGGIEVRVELIRACHPISDIYYSTFRSQYCPLFTAWKFVWLTLLVQLSSGSERIKIMAPGRSCSSTASTTIRCTWNRYR